VNSGDVFKNNIVFKSYQPAIMDRAIPKNGKWGKELDYNFYAADSATTHRFIANDCDRHSGYGDPLFKDPEKGDFRVKEGSPALKIGFVNFPTDQFGVLKPSLKVLTKKPVIPLVKVNVAASIRTVSKSVTRWKGVELTEPVGAELSAYGVSFSTGGVALGVVIENSPLAKAGFTNGDLIFEINGQSIRNIIELKEYLIKSGTELLHKFKVIRNQSKSEVIVRQRLITSDLTEN
jgi:hypothetical protein